MSGNERRLSGKSAGNGAAVWRRRGPPSGVGPNLKIMQILIRSLLAAAALGLAGCASHQTKTRVVVPKCSINGRPARMFLDTGCETTVLFDEQARRLGLNAGDISEP